MGNVAVMMRSCKSKDEVIDGEDTRHAWLLAKLDGN